MLHRRSIDWPINDGKDHENGIAVTFQHEAAHGDEYDGADNDGETVRVTFEDEALAAELQALMAKGLLSWPSSEKRDLHDRIFAAAEAVHASKGSFSGARLAPFTPASQIPSIHDIESDMEHARIAHDEGRVHVSPIEANDHRDRAVALLMTRRSAKG